MEKLMISVAGVRGIVGESFTPEVVKQYVTAFVSTLSDGPIVLGRDSRPSGAQFREVIVETLTALGRDVIDLGIVSTPTVQIIVEEEHAAGGIALTASHNPIQWNALKFVSAAGRFFTKEEGKPLLDAAEKHVELPAAQTPGTVRLVTDANERHCARIFAAGLLDKDAVRSRKLHVVVDALHGAAGPIARLLLESLGCQVTVMAEEPTGAFSRPAEPLPQNITGLCENVRKLGADVGFALDPDGDRLALVDERGEPLGENATLVLAVMYFLERQKGPVVANLSTTAALRAVTDAAHCELFRSPIGEANVVQEIMQRQAIIGGEGSGGVIVPAVHLGRDASVAMAMIVALLATRTASISTLAAQVPQLTFVNSRVEGLSEIPFERLRSDLRQIMPNGVEDVRDGFHFSHDYEWVHVRKSGTEPIMRVMAEAESEERANALANAARASLTA